MRTRTLVLLLIAVLLGDVAAYLVPRPLPELSRDELLAEAKQGRVRSLVIEDSEVIVGESSASGAFRTPLGKSDIGLIDQLRGFGVEIRFEKSRPNLF